MTNKKKVAAKPKDMEEIYRPNAGTVRQLHSFLSRLLQDGKGSHDVYFDTEARQFNYHCAIIGAASWFSKKYAGHPMVVLYERRPEKKTPYKAGRQ